MYAMAAIFQSTAFAITTNELRQIVKENKESLSRIHVVYTEEYNDNREKDGQLEVLRNAVGTRVDPETLEKTLQLQKHQKKRVDTFVDRDTKNVKMSCTDLRDISDLLKKKSLPAVQKSNVSLTKDILIKGNYFMDFVGSDNFDNQQNAVLSLQSVDMDMNKDFFDVLFLGILDERYLSDDYSLVLSEEKNGGTERLKIETTRGKKGENKGVVICDPSLAYRVREIKWYTNNKLIKEIIIDDYRMVDGIPYSFSYAEKSYDTNGNIILETTCKVDHAELNKEFPPDVFKLNIPDGTIVQDLIVAQQLYTMKKGGLFGIQDILAQQADKQAAEELQNINTAQQSLGNKSALIPNAFMARKSDKPFVFDLSNAKLISIPLQDSFDTEPLYDYLKKLGQGDFAWDGTFVTLRSATLVDNSKAQPVLKRTKGRWINSYEFPKDIQLPYTFFIKTQEGVNFEIAIKEIGSEGIKISYCRAETN
jgi:hypothetical protein